jgi:hypothetical protein
MPRSFARRSAGWQWTERATASLGLLAIAVWLGGLVALGALAAPVVFSVAPWPASADAMSIVFRRFDHLAMACAVLVLVAEVAGSLMRPSRIVRLRTLVATLAAGVAAVEGTAISPRIAQLHADGAIRGVGIPGRELARLHDWAEVCGKAQVALLVALVVLHVLVLTTPHGVHTAERS